MVGRNKSEKRGAKMGASRDGRETRTSEQRGPGAASRNGLGLVHMTLEVAVVVSLCKAMAGRALASVCHGGWCRDLMSLWLLHSKVSWTVELLQASFCPRRAHITRLDR